MEKSNSAKAIEKKFEDRVLFCAFQKDRLVGTIALKGREVVGLYVAYSKSGIGIGKELLSRLEKYVLKNSIEELELTSTLAGYKFYKKMDSIQKRLFWLISLE